MLIAFVVASSVLAGLLSFPIWTAMTGESALNIEEGMTNPANSNAVKVIQIITAVVGFLLPVLLTAQILNRRPMKLLGFKGTIKWREISVVFAIVITALFVSAGLAYFNQHIPVDASWKVRFDKMEADYIKQASAILSLNNFGEYLLAIFIMAFCLHCAKKLCFVAVFKIFYPVQQKSMAGNYYCKHTFQCGAFFFLWIFIKSFSGNDAWCHLSLFRKTLAKYTGSLY